MKTKFRNRLQDAEFPKVYRQEEASTDHTPQRAVPLVLPVNNKTGLNFANVLWTISRGLPCSI